ncbi:hypothetical protein PM082_010187 [Marasmius tenuissimus]|nr:hypothetical protein PM082_010187 [Marasmius tenuissimus]
MANRKAISWAFGTSRTSALGQAAILVAACSIHDRASWEKAKAIGKHVRRSGTVTVGLNEWKPYTSMACTFGQRESRRRKDHCGGWSWGGLERYALGLFLRQSTRRFSDSTSEQSNSSPLIKRRCSSAEKSF